MRDTGGKHITNMFSYKHHTIFSPKITATDHILEETHHLTTAIEGIQEATPDKLQANELLCYILLGKTPLQQPHLAKPPSNNHTHHLPHLSMTLSSTKNLSMCGIQLAAHRPPCPQHQPHLHLRLGMPSSTMKQCPALPCVIGASRPTSPHTGQDQCTTDCQLPANLCSTA